MFAPRLLVSPDLVHGPPPSASHPRGSVARVGRPWPLHPLRAPLPMALHSVKSPGRWPCGHRIVPWRTGYRLAGGSFHLGVVDLRDTWCLPVMYLGWTCDGRLVSRCKSGSLPVPGCVMIAQFAQFAALTAAVPAGIARLCSLPGGRPCRTCWLGRGARPRYGAICRRACRLACGMPGIAPVPAVLRLRGCAW